MQGLKKYLPLAQKPRFSQPLRGLSAAPVAISGWVKMGSGVRISSLTILRGECMIVRILLLLLGISHIVNGLFMLIAPAEWYASVPGVTATGPFNPHFILDIGMAFVASGAGLMLGARRGASAAIL